METIDFIQKNIEKVTKSLDKAKKKSGVQQTEIDDLYEKLGHWAKIKIAYGLQHQF